MLVEDLNQALCESEVPSRPSLTLPRYPQSHMTSVLYSISKCSPSTKTLYSCVGFVAFHRSYMFSTAQDDALDSSQPSSDNLSPTSAHGTKTPLGDLYCSTQHLESATPSTKEHFASPVQSYTSGEGSRFTRPAHREVDLS